MTIFITGTTNQRIIGTSAGDDIFAVVGSSGNDTVFARSGDDEVRGGDGNDLLFGESGNDTLSGNANNDRLFGGLGDDTLFGGDGDDVLAVETNLSNFGTDRLSGGAGFDRVTFETANIISVNGSPVTTIISPASAGVFVNMISSFVPGFVGTIGNVQGGSTEIFELLSSPKGTIRDSSGTSAVFADIEEFDLTSFTDEFLDSSASHIIDGGAGDDFIRGGGGADVIDGGDGNDTAMYFGSATGVSISLLDFGSGGSGSFGDAQGDKLFNIENVFGSGHDDFVLGDGKANILRGQDGNDQLLGGAGADTVDGGEGNDTLRGGTGNDRIAGGNGTDGVQLLDWNGNTAGFLSSLSGAITLAEGTADGKAILTRSTFNTSTFTTTKTVIETDTLNGIENVAGSDFADTITGNSGSNTLEGRNGNDTLDGNKGSDILIGGDGIDTAAFTAGVSIFLNQMRVDASLERGTAFVTRGSSGFPGSILTETDTLSGIENLTGSIGGDLLTGNSGANVLDGGKGNDTLAGLGGADKLTGGEGLDTIDYSASASGVAIDLASNLAAGGDAAGDTYSGIENVTGSNSQDTLSGNVSVNIIKGNGGNDVIEGGAGGDTLDGGTEIDTLSYAHSAGVTVSLDGQLIASGDAAGDVIFNFENISGSETAGDTLRGNANSNVLSGQGGNDILQGGAGGDVLDGGEGFDFADYSLDGAVRIDLLDGSFAGAAAGDTFTSIEGIIGGDGGNVIKGDDIANTFTASTGDNTLQGRGGDDTLTAGSGRDTLAGGGDNDTLAGGGNIDTLQGNQGDDTLDGGRGADTLNGGAGDDILFGGLGADTFVFTGRNIGRDTINDFESGLDTIQITNPDVTSFTGITFVGNGTDHVTVVFGAQAFDIIVNQPLTLTASDFSFI